MADGGGRPQCCYNTVEMKERIVVGMSGGVDSAVAATLVHRAIGDRLTCVFVDHGLLRLGEAEQVVERLVPTLRAFLA